MKILHLIPTFRGGGAERQLALLAREQARLGVQVAVIYHSEGPNLDTLQNSGVELFQLSMRSNHDPGAIWSIVRLIRSWRPDLMQTWLPQMDVLGGVAARLTGVPHVLSERASSLAYDGGWKNRLRHTLGRRAKAIIANSQEGANHWKRIASLGPVYVVANAIAPFDQQTDAPPAALKSPCILYAGRLTQQKNLKPMIDAMALALQTRSDLQAYLLGVGPLETELRQRIEHMKLSDRIHLVGYVKDMYPWYRNADVFVSVSDFEGHPNVVLEAASVGCPLVLSHIPEHRAAIPVDGALFVDGHKPNEIATALLQVLDDEAGAKFRAESAKVSVSVLSVERQTREYLRIYQTLL